MADEEKKDKPKTEKPKKNTIKMTLINSNGDEITADGPCCDKELKAICRIIHSYDGKRITMIK